MTYEMLRRATGPAGADPRPGPGRRRSSGSSSRRRTVGAVLLAVGLLVVAACSQAVEGAPQATAGGPPAAGGPDPARLPAVLLTPADVGTGWGSAPEQPEPDSSAPAVCGGPAVVARFPDAARLGTALRSGGDETLQETVSVYPDLATSRAAFDAGAAGLACSEGSLGGTPVVLTPAEDVQFDVGGDRALAWNIGGDRFDAVLVSVQAGAAVVNFVFVTPIGGQPTRPDPLVLARTGVARLLAA